MRSSLAAVLVAAAVTLVGCHDGTNTFAPVPAVADPTITTPAPAPTPAHTATPSAAPDADPALAATALATLPVKGRAPKTGYTREQFGPVWTDDDHNGCDTRNDILARDLEDEKLKPGTNDCVVLTGKLDDPYTGKKIDFLRGPDTSAAVQIDHVVPLSDAWQKGAQQITTDDRLHFANDPENLQATDGPTNQAKGDGDAATWLPPDRGYRCTYVARQVAVKAKYRLWVTQAERDAMTGILAGCPDEKLPTEAA